MASLRHSTPISIYTGTNFDRVIDQPADLRSNTDMALIVSSQKTTARAMNSIHTLLSENHPCTLFMVSLLPATMQSNTTHYHHLRQMYLAANKLPKLSSG